MLALILGLVFLFYHNGPSAVQASTSGGTGTGGTGSSPASQIPEAASTSFAVSPGFSAQTQTVSSTVEDNAGNTFHINLSPTLHGFELNVLVHVTVPANLSLSPVEDIADNCMDIAVPAEGNVGSQGFSESPVSSNLTESSGAVTGSLSYAAVLPGSYGFDLGCLSRGSVGQAGISLGKVTTSNLGVSAGAGSNYDNAVVVFSEQTSQTDTTISYGVIGGSSDGSLTQTAPNSCVVYTPPQQNNELAHPAAQATKQHITGDGQYFETGTLTFNLSASQIDSGSATGAQFSYNCPPGDSASSIVDNGERVNL
jgi:hypothetical protein